MAERIGPGGGMTETTRIEDREDRLIEVLLAQRERVSHAFFTAEAGRLAKLCHRMAVRFERGGRLIACGMSPLTRSDARHIAVEFVHPVIVGKRALPAIALTAESGLLPDRLVSLLAPQDVLVLFDDDPPAPASLHALRAAVAAARRLGALTLAFAPVGAEWELDPPTTSRFLRQELTELLYHVLWELVHVFFEHPGLLDRRAAAHADDGGASAFLYPFLGESEHNLEAVIDDVRRSVLMKEAEADQLRRQTDAASRSELLRAARLLRTAFRNGGTVLAFGNGGSATDAMDAVADLLDPPEGWARRRAIDLTEDTSILTAIANDVGVELVFARQIIAYGRPGDVAVAFTTSGSSRNVIAALEESRRRGLATIAFVGYDGGRIREQGLADAVVLAPSQNIPRIQEAHATAFHLLRRLVETAAEEPGAAVAQPEHEHGARGRDVRVNEPNVAGRASGSGAGTRAPRIVIG